ncbi:hypothetical protein Patl1_14535 [Pistacia atlantica]|uniref:Uncharacterized protein n=1 Tax=Pistacia atlantica TaxID=434234 RepID=A0ACC1AUY4_9ROSI|nr:hypothetical protein Patl1_14535 [Pistacia atlantica]
MLGHAECVQELLGRKPELVGELDSRKSSPLHLATSKGCLDIVKILVSVNPELCLARDRDGKNPVHIAVMKGRVSVLKELVKVRRNAARMLMERGETILHACDDDGNTKLHLAMADKQVEERQQPQQASARVGVSRSDSGLGRNCTILILEIFTALDILKQSKRDLKDYEIVELLRRWGAISTEDIAVSTHELGFEQTRTLTSHGNNQINMLHPQGNCTENSIQKKVDLLKEMNNALMVVASLIATVTFQAGLNPPVGVWQDTRKDPS